MLWNISRSGEISVVGFRDINAMIIIKTVEKGKCNHYPSLEKVSKQRRLGPSEAAKTE